MAAPTISASQRKTNLSSLSLKENTPKVTRKNILCPASQEWPRVPKDVEDSILTKLTEKLANRANIVTHSRKSSISDKSEKARLRSQVEIGTSSVFRALERDDLACILISGQATPAITVDHILSLARDRGCPLLCLDQLAPTVARVTESKCLPLAIGFKNIEDSHSDFTEVISIVTANVMVSSTQKNQSLTVTEHMSSMDNVQPRKTNKHRPVQVTADAEQEILNSLKKILSKGLTGNSDKDKRVKKKKKKRNLKDSFKKIYHCQFDIGKRTVTSFLERGKYEIILVSEEIVPVLLSETHSFSLLSLAAAKTCPVIIVPGLVAAMRTLCCGCVNILGLKKKSSLEDEDNNFNQVIDICLQAVRHQQSSPVNVEATRKPGESYLQAASVTLSSAQPSRGVEATHEQKELIDKDREVTSKSDALSDDDEDGEDYSYLYILKTESKELAEVKDELKALTTKTENAFSSDYISLSEGLNELKSQSSSSSVKQKGFISTKQKTKPTASLKSDKSKVIVAETGCSVQQEVGFTSLTESGQHTDIPESGSGKEISLDMPLFAICRSGKSQKSFGDTVQTKGEVKAHSTDTVIGLGMGSTLQRQNKTPLFAICRSGESQRSMGDASQQREVHKEGKIKADIPNVEATLGLETCQTKNETPLFSICRSGNSVSNDPKLSSKAYFQKQKPNRNKSFADDKGGATTLGVQELSVSTDKYRGIDCLSLVESSKSEKKAVKRKLQNDSSYISFAYTEANIQTMVSNPNKKRKKKKPKK